MKTAEIRTKFLTFFESQGHTIVESSSLVPHNDPTLLFTNAGMNQFKDVFLGKEHRDYKRATSSQKCVRAGGKHNDLENVGFTARHHTFFEMLGNFSFGDYFKPEAIRMAWAFVTKELQLPKDRLYVSVYKDDEEAAQIWHQQEGVPLDRISRFGEKDNFWQMGDTGPCGPCTEIFYDRGEQYGGPNCKNNPDCKVGCDCDRFLEFWNLVFMQFNRDASGTLTPLPKPSVDTGAGLERIASILQNAPTNYDTDAFLEILTVIGTTAGRRYEPQSPLASSFRVIADHARATTFLISDGVLPSNEGRGYVLRRIMRRAIRHGKKLGFSGPFFARICTAVIDQMKSAYPSLIRELDLVQKVVHNEEEQFLRTLDRGLATFDEALLELQKSPRKTTEFPGSIAFKLYDTYGFPLDLTKTLCQEHSLSVNEAEFDKEMERQREGSRKNWKGSGEVSLDTVYYQVKEALDLLPTAPEFVGYESTACDSKILALVELNSGSVILKSEPGQNLGIITEKTPFYGESGGQIGDTGIIRLLANNQEVRVIDSTKPLGSFIVHHIEASPIQLRVNDPIRLEINTARRQAIARNHTATHLLHAALRSTLGPHVKQSGSLVTDQLLRFDFTHFQPLTEAEIRNVEDLIQTELEQLTPVTKQEMSKEAAESQGALAFFGEKYGATVRVVQIGQFSTELCGGTHVSHSQEIQLFRISSESGIASGVRRIIATTGREALRSFQLQDHRMKALRSLTKASSDDEILIRIEKLQSTERDITKQLEQLRLSQAKQELAHALAQPSVHHGVSWISHIWSVPTGASAMGRELMDQIRAQFPNQIALLVLHEVESAKSYLLCGSGKEIMAKYPAKDMIQSLSGLIGGKGGGKQDFAQAGGTKTPSKAELDAHFRTWLDSR